jgi:NADH-quinone oxidoreductase subunit C
MGVPLYCTKIAKRFGREVEHEGHSHGMHVFAAPPSVVVDLCRFLKDDPELRFNFLSDICGVDRYPQTPRFEVVYHLYSIPLKWRLRIKCRVDDPPRVSSVVGVWKTANWHEREAYDMYGIVFDGHPDLRRIYMWEEFEGYPMRKDFPLRGYKDTYNPFGEEKTETSSSSLSDDQDNNSPQPGKKR